MRPGLFFWHLLIVGILAPSVGLGGYFFMQGNWGQTCLSTRLFRSLGDGILYSSFIWFFTIPFACLTIARCHGLCSRGHTRRIVWVLNGIVLGGGCSFLFTLLFMGPLSIGVLVIDGMVIGAISGQILNWLWARKPLETSNPRRLL